MNPLDMEICRICLIDPGIISIYDKKNDIKLSDMIMMFTEVKIHPNENLPSTVCQVCEMRIENIYTFKTEIEQSDKKLRALLQSRLINIKVELAIEELSYTNVMPEVKEEAIENEIKPLMVETNITEIRATENLSEEINEKSNTKRKIRKSKTKALDGIENQTVESRTCKICGKVFARHQNLIIHERIHSGEKPHGCYLCEKKFIQKSNLLLHLKTHSREKMYICEVCSKQFLTILQLRQHMLTHLPESAKRYHCDICPKAFHENRTLKRHHATHEGNKKFICLTCQKGFITKCYLNKHNRTVHLSIKSHVCSVCKKAFSNSGNLKAHFRTHTGEKPYQCKYCPAKFNQSTPHVRHTQQHITRGDAIIFS